MFYKVYPWVWIFMILWFIVFEFTPLAAGKPQYTLSDYVWRLEEINRSWTFLRWCVASLSLFLFLHLTFGILR